MLVVFTLHVNYGAAMHRPTHAEQAMRQLRQEIQAGRLLPGQLLSQAQLAQQFGMSRTPVREALQRLEHEGLLTSLPQRGWTVRSLDIREVEEVYAIRKQLELLAVRFACERHAAEDLRTAAEILERQSEAVAKHGEPDKLHVLDREFHDTIWTMARSPRLCATLRAVADSAILDPAKSYMQTPAERAQLSVVEHEALLQAIEAREIGRAEEALRRHADNTWLAFGELLFGSKMLKEQK